MRIAYVVNQYPKVSHAFIRREVRALESQGASVFRFSLRGSPDALKDEADIEEQQRTRVVLASGAKGLARGTLKQGVSHPARFARALGLALKLSWKSERGLLRHLAYFAEACVLYDWLSEVDAEHVHAHFGTNSAAVAMLCHELGGPPFSFTVHGPEEFDKAPMLGLSEKIRRARYVFGVSSFGKSQLFRYTDPGEWRKVHVIRCGVDDAFLTAPAVPIPEAPKLCCVGRLCEQKGQLLLLEALGTLKRENIDFQLTLVGDGEMRAEVEAAIAEHDLADRVTITGWASGEAVRRELESSRAMVLPSFAEGLPVVIMEALALGRPVVTTYVAGIPELVESGKTGWLVPAGSVPALADALRELLQAKPEQLAAMGAEGRRRVGEQHSITTIARELDELFSQPGAV